MSSTPKHNLVALSSAAIIAVYAAGFVRTKAAAAKIAEREVRRPPIRTTTPRPAPEAATASSRVVATKPKAAAKPKAKSQARADTAVAMQAATAAPPTIEAAPTARPTAGTSASAAPVVAPTDTAKRVDSAKVVRHDGYYFGWGTSRHGDIQAAIEIKDGRIASATITQCLTQYSCSWIAHLPGQVVARQSPEVDFVSGATQSTNAFYYAVVEALKQSK